MREGNGKYFGDRVNDYIQDRERQGKKEVERMKEKERQSKKKRDKKK